ncbi:MAG: hypothetical protein OIN87_09985 [Candidatus Methanoperedens sp.]|nr:hypothetical protein [Candidatus Methanoperedens sp.]
MNLRKSISLNDEYIKKIDPLIKKHNGNLSAVIREIIDFSDFANKDPDSVKRMMMGLKNRQSLTSSTLAWAIKNLAGRLPDEEMIHNVVGNNINSISSLEKHLNELMGEVYWNSSIKINSESERFPENIFFTITGNNQDMNRFLAAVVSVFVSNKYDLAITNLVNLNGSVVINMKRGEKEEVKKSISENFGFMDNAYIELYKKPDFWNMIISLNVKMNYEMALMPKQLFEEILGGKTHHSITTIIERFYGCPVNQIPLEDLLIKIREIYQYTGIIEKIDIDKRSLIIHHTFSDPQAIQNLADMFIELLKIGGNTYNSVTSRNLIVLRHTPRENKILVKLISDLRYEEGSTRNYSDDLQKMLTLLRNMPFNEDIIKSLGSQFGKTMIQNYEKDRKIDIWDAQIFIKYLKETCVILDIDLNIDVISKNTIYAKIMTSSHGIDIAKSIHDARSNDPNCIFLNGIFGGWISHAFGENTEIVQTTSQEPGSGNEYCDFLFNINGTG